MKSGKLISAAAAAVMAVFGLAAAAPASAQTHAAQGSYNLHAHVINLARAYKAHLGHTKHAKISGIVYARGKQPKAPSVKGTCMEPNCPLVYHGGSVQHSPHIYLLLWGPNWSSDSSQAASASYLESFYHGLGAQPQDNWSTTTSQYNDGTGHPTFSGSVYMGVWQDTTTPPSGATQSQLATEADAFASSQSITDVTDAQIIVATQSGTCPAGFYAPSCSGGTGTYCAWHSNSNEPYTNLPYLLDAGTGCGENFINSGSGGLHDGLSIVGGHEYAETITDPYPASGWYDTSDSVSGGEIGDKCAWRGANWGGSDPAGNVTLSTGTFAMQSLWSNSANGCVMSTSPAGNTVTVTESGTGASGGTVTSSPSGISCPGTCSASFASGTPVTLTATPPGGGVFTGWTGPCYGMASNTCSFTVTSATAVGASFTASATVTQENGPGVSYVGKWTVSNCLCFSGGHTLYSTTAGNSATFKFTGNLIQFVSEKAANRGSFKVYLDGKYLTTVSNYNATARSAVIVWQKAFTAVGAHTLKIVVVGTSGHPRVDVDAFVVAT